MDKGLCACGSPLCLCRVLCAGVGEDRAVGLVVLQSEMGSREVGYSENESWVSGGVNNK